MLLMDINRLVIMIKIKIDISLKVYYLKIKTSVQILVATQFLDSRT